MKKIFLFVICVVLLASAESWSLPLVDPSMNVGSMTDSMTIGSSSTYEIEQRNLTAEEVVEIAAGFLSPKFEEGDKTFVIYEKFFRDFLDHYPVCIAAPQGRDYNVIRKVKNKEKTTIVIIEYPFYDEECEVRDVDLIYTITKNFRTNKIEFNFKNDYSYLWRTVIAFWIETRGVTDIIPLNTNIKIEGYGTRSLKLKATTTAFTNVTVEQLQIHNRKLLKSLARLINEDVIPGM